MPSDAKGVFQFYANRGSNDREVMFKMIDHFNELHWKNDQQLRGEIDMLKKRLGKDSDPA